MLQRKALLVRRKRMFDERTRRGVYIPARLRFEYSIDGALANNVAVCVTPTLHGPELDRMANYIYQSDVLPKVLNMIVIDYCVPNIRDDTRHMLFGDMTLRSMLEREGIATRLKSSIELLDDWNNHDVVKMVDKAEGDRDAVFHVLQVMAFTKDMNSPKVLADEVNDDDDEYKAHWFKKGVVWLSDEQKHRWMNEGDGLTRWEEFWNAAYKAVVSTKVVSSGYYYWSKNYWGYIIAKSRTFQQMLDAEGK